MQTSLQPNVLLFSVALADVLYIDMPLMVVFFKSLGLLAIFITIVMSDDRSGPKSTHFSQEQHDRHYPKKEQFLWSKLCYEDLQSLVGFNAVINKAAVQRDMWTVKSELRAMEISGIKPCVDTYNCILSGLAQAKDWRKAESWLAEMRKAGFAPTVESYTSVINACRRKNTLNGAARAERWFNHMIAEGIQPDKLAFTAIINAWAKVGNLTNAVRFFDMMEEMGVERGVIHYTQVLDACARVGTTDMSGKVFAQMQAAGVKPDMYTYTAVARALAVNGDYEGIERMQDDMDLEPNEHFLCALLTAYGNAEIPNLARARDAVEDAMLRGVPVKGNLSLSKALDALCQRCQTAAQ